MSQMQVFDSIPNEDPFHLFEGSQPNIEKVMDVLKFSKQDVAKASNVPVSSVRWDNKMPAELLERITEWAVAISLVSLYFKDLDRTVLWFGVRNPLLGGISPRDMIRIGRFKKLLKFIHSAINENKK